MRSSLRAVLGGACVLGLLTACASKNDRPAIDYRTSGAENASARLEVPPDLVAPARDERFLLSELNRNQAAASQTTPAANAATAPVSAAGVRVPEGMRIERAGAQRWLVVPASSAETLWPKLADFWKSLGFIVVEDNPLVGVMETDWAENRAKLRQDPIQNALGKVLGSFVSTGERDKFRLRVERTAQPGKLEIFISHRRMEEVAKSAVFADGTIWVPRSADMQLEGEMLQRLMVHLGVAEAAAEQAVAQSRTVAPEQARLTEQGGQQSLLVQQPLDRAWRQVGLALDRIGVVVEDRDRARNLYSVRHLAAEEASKEGFWSRLAFWRSKPVPGTSQYQVKVLAQGDQQSVITLLDKHGGVAPAEAARQILGLLHEQLK
jgi:outer membrane protein assembly factor BamC